MRLAWRIMLRRDASKPCEIKAVAGLRFHRGIGKPLGSAYYAVITFDKLGSTGGAEEMADTRFC